MTQISENRPDITTIRNSETLKRWYWLKDELISCARTYGLKTSGGKFEILDRIGYFLDTGSKTAPGDQAKPKASTFDWHGAKLSLATVITDNYKNSQNVRRFFCKEIGAQFKFTIALMDWMKANTGKTLADAVNEYHRLTAMAAKPGFKTNIKSHNQFNQYMRDILSDNPRMGIGEVRRIWARKRALPSEDGRHVYHRSDLNLLD